MSKNKLQFFGSEEWKLRVNKYEYQVRPSFVNLLYFYIIFEKHVLLKFTDEDLCELMIVSQYLVLLMCPCRCHEL